MLDDRWAHGDSEAALERSIRSGWPENGMPAFGTLLSDEEIRGLVADIRDAHEHAKSAPPRSVVALSGTVKKSELHPFRIETVVDQLQVPWGIAFLPDGKMLVSERPGRLRVIEVGRGIVQTITGLPKVWERQDGGLLDVAVHPDYAHNGWVYLALSESGGSGISGWGASATKIVRGHIRDGAWVDQQTIFQAAPEFYWRSNIHYGSRFLFDRQGMLYFSIGDRGHRGDAQLLTSPWGKLHRVRDDGTIPADNPFVGEKDAVKSIWSFGHRNQQGLAESPVTGEIWAIEHGPEGGDELNVIARGHNYGWPVISWGILEDGSMPQGTTREGMDQPVRHWEPPFAPGSLMFYTRDEFPRWHNHLFVGAMAAQELHRLELDGHKVVHEEVIFHGLGRVRALTLGPDGFIYVSLDGGWGEAARIVRLVPAD